MTPEELKKLHGASSAFKRAEYAAKKLAATGKPVRARADLTGWTDEQKLERQRQQAKMSMRRIHAARRAARLETEGE